MSGVSLHATVCAICGTAENSQELYPANFDAEAFNPVVFSARRMPDRIHSRIVKCNTCGLLRADPVADSEALAELYRQSTFDYSSEVGNLKETYRRYLEKMKKHSAPGAVLMEVGCGNGFVLEEALKLGFADVRGVEPSSHAVGQAAPALKGKIVCDILRPGVFAADSFDGIALFQVFDHLPDPNGVLQECRRLLKSDGRILFLNHNVDANSAKLLGRKSPIIDIEHTYLYNQETMEKILRKNGLRVVGRGAVFNTYTLYYLARLFPLPGALKRIALGALEGTGLGKIKLRVPLGNLFVIAERDRA